MSQPETPESENIQYNLKVSARKISAEILAYPIPGFGNTDFDLCIIRPRSYEYESKGIYSDTSERARTYYKRNGIPATWWHNGSESDTHEHSDEEAAPDVMWDDAERIVEDAALSHEDTVRCLLLLAREGFHYPECIIEVRKRVATGMMR